MRKHLPKYVALVFAKDDVNLRFIYFKLSTKTYVFVIENVIKYLFSTKSKIFTLSRKRVFTFHVY